MKLIGLAVAVAAGALACGCTSYKVDQRLTEGLHSNNVPSVMVLPCPLCGAPAHLRRYWLNIELHNGLARCVPSDVADPNWLYNCGCTNRECVVERSMPYSYWRAADAASEWNRLVERHCR